MNTSKKSIAWLAPLFTNAGGFEVCVGLDEGGHWYVKYDAPLEITRRSINRELLPLLEPGFGGTFYEVRAALEDRMRAAGKPVQLAGTFPFEVPVRTALQLDGFWAAIALDWLEHIAVDEAMTTDLLKVSQFGATGGIRNAAFTAVRRWETLSGRCLVRPKGWWESFDEQP